MPHLCPQTLTQDEQKAILRATTRNLRDHLIYSLALGTGLRLAEIVGLNVGDVYTTDAKPRNRVRVGSSSHLSRCCAELLVRVRFSSIQSVPRQSHERARDVQVTLRPATLRRRQIRRGQKV